MSLARVSRESILQEFWYREHKKTCILHSAEHGRWLRTKGLHDDESVGKDEGIQSGSAKSRPYVEETGVSTYSCSSELSRCSGNENEVDISKPVLRLRLNVKHEDGSHPTQMGLEEQESSVRSIDRKERYGTNKVVKEGTEGCPEVGSAIKSDLKASMSCRPSWYSLRPHPERHRRYQSDDLQKVIKRRSSSDRRQKRIEIKEIDKEEVEEDTGQQAACARVDFVYNRNERSYVLPEAPGPLLRNEVSFLTRGSESDRRSQRREAQLFISRSNIHGKGLFTKREIVAGRLILEFVGEKIRTVISDLREKKYEEKGSQSCYMFRDDSGMVIDSTRKGSMGRFINHSCTPNSAARSAGDRIFVHALRLIEEGEEITMDYGRGDGSYERRCNCGATGCRGVVAV